MSQIKRTTEARIAAYLRREYLRWKKQREAYGEGATRTEFAELLGLGQVYVSRVLAGERDAGVDTARALRRTFDGLTYQQLLDVDPEDRYFEGLPPVFTPRRRKSEE